MQDMLRAFSLAIDKAGKSIAARMEMIAITTSNSISVKPGAKRDRSNLLDKKVDTDRYFSKGFSIRELSSSFCENGKIGLKHLHCKLAFIHSPAQRQ